MSKLDDITRGLIVYVGTEAYRRNGLHFSAEDRALAASVTPLTRRQAKQQIKDLYHEIAQGCIQVDEDVKYIDPFKLAKEIEKL